MNIIEIYIKKNVNIQNLHNEVIYPKQSILVVSYENGSERIIDLMSEKDITDIDYFKVIESDKTKKRILFNDLDRITLKEV